MPRHDQRVQLPEHRERRPGARPPLGVGADARQREPRARGQAQLLERLLDQPRRLDLFEAEFGVAPDLLTEPDDLRAASIDRLPHLPLQLVLRHGRPSVQKPLDILLPRDGLRRHTVSMDYHHVLEAAGVVVFGLVFYSYTFRWFHPKGRLEAWWRPVITGLAFGVLAVVLMISRIRVHEDLFIDARVVPLALPFLVMSVVGIVFGAFLFRDIVESQAAERDRREAAELRAVTSLARAAAHEINNPLMIVTGGLAILAKRLASGSEEARWAERAKEGAERIREIVGRMNEITEVREAPEQGMLPPMLDIRKSSEGASSPPR